jgi:hypothetical protein
MCNLQMNEKMSRLSTAYVLWDPGHLDRTGLPWQSNLPADPPPVPCHGKWTEVRSAPHQTNKTQAKTGGRDTLRRGSQSYIAAHSNSDLCCLRTRRQPGHYNVSSDQHPFEQFLGREHVPAPFGDHLHTRLSVNASPAHPCHQSRLIAELRPCTRNLPSAKAVAKGRSLARWGNTKHQQHSLCHLMHQNTPEVPNSQRKTR